jgi:hypothetical protein
MLTGSFNGADSGEAINTELLTSGLELLAKGTTLPSMPNIPFITGGGEVFWKELANVNGWRVQQHKFTGHCRVLDPDNIRIAWGGIDAITGVFARLIKK